MSLENRIFKSISIMCIMVFILTSLITVYDFKNYYFEKEKGYVRSQAYMLEESMEDEKTRNLDEFLKMESRLYRITLISNDGEVLYDSATNKEMMDNHKSRPEIIDSLSNEFGESTRYSETLDVETYNYALKLSNGNILRVSKVIDGYFVSLIQLLFKNLAKVIILLIAILIISKKITEYILNPIENITIEANENVDIDGEGLKLQSYEELNPLVTKINKQDIEMRKAITKLKGETAIMNNITYNMKEGILLLDNEKSIINYNESGIRQLSGEISKDYKGNNILILCRNIDLYHGIEESLETSKALNVLVKEDNSFKNVFISPVINDDVNIGIVLFILDVTEQKKAEKIRREFSSNVSHELKSPLTSINGYAEMISAGIVSDHDEIKKFARVINKEGQRLLELINSIIRLSQLEEKRSEDDLNEVDIYPLLFNTMDRFKLLSEERDVKLRLTGKDYSIVGNEVMVEEMIYNLVENGIKHSKAENLNINVFEEENYINISIKDDGIGIAEQDKDRIFERFYIVDESRTKENNSTGLGLSIVKHIAEYHKAKINIKSEINEGTEIIISFPKEIEEI